MTPEISTELNELLTKCGVSLTGQEPSPECTRLGPGGCAKACNLLRALEDRVRTGELSDERLIGSTEQEVSGARSHGCTVLAIDEAHSRPPLPPAVTTR